MNTRKDREASWRIIPANVHGMFDYGGAIVLMLAPNIFGFADAGGPATWIPRIIGIVVLLQALFTDYDLGILRVISMKTHLMNDYIASALLAFSPWIFGFWRGPLNMWVPHVVVGVAVFILSMMTEEYAPTSRTTGGFQNATR